MDQLSDEFVNSGRSTNFDFANNQITTSSILNWFSADFVKTFGSVKNFFLKYANIISANQVNTMSLSYSNYNWLLNESKEVVVKPTQEPSGEVGSGSEDPVCPLPEGSGSETPPECKQPPVERGSGVES